MKWIIGGGRVDEHGEHHRDPVQEIEVEHFPALDELYAASEPKVMMVSSDVLELMKKALNNEI